jgi:hypothetical protein
MGCAQTFLRVLKGPATYIFRKHAQELGLLPLALLVALVGADDVDDAPAAHDLAVLADLLD